MKVLVTGGAGFIGSHTIEELLKRGHAVSCLNLKSSLPSSLRDSGRVRQSFGNLADRAVLAESLASMDAVVHLAWSSVPHSTIECPEIDVQQNVFGSIALLDACVQAGVKKVVFLSSGGTVYGLAQALPITEKHPVAPLCPYGITKAATEHYLYLYSKLHGLECAVLRASNVYGPRHRAASGQGVVGVWLHRCLQRQPLELFGDGSMVRDFVYVTDVARAVALALERHVATETFNIGTACGTTLMELLDRIEESLGHAVEVRRKPARSFDVPVNVLDNSRAKKQLGWEPEVDLEQGIRNTWAWLTAGRAVLP